MDPKDISLINRLQKNIDDNLKTIGDLIILLEGINTSSPSFNLNPTQIKDIYNSLLENLRQLVAQSQEQINITGDIVKDIENHKNN